MLEIGSVMYGNTVNQQFLVLVLMLLIVIGSLSLRLGTAFDRGLRGLRGWKNVFSFGRDGALRCPL